MQPDRRFHNRRKGPDLWLKSLILIALSGWFILVVSLMVVDKAKPQLKTYFERRYHIQIRDTWDKKLGTVAFFLMIAGLVAGVVGLIINSTRHKRKSDKYRVSLISLVIISFVGSLYFLFRIFLH